MTYPDTLIYKFLNMDTGALVDSIDELIQQIGPVGSTATSTDFRTMLVAASTKQITEKQAVKKYHEVIKAGQGVLI